MIDQKIKKRATCEKLQRWMLRKAKITHLGLFEAINMKWLGTRDGRNELPRQSQNGGWESPRLRKESNAYNEFCNRAWGLTQFDLKEDYAVVGGVIDEINRKEEILERLIQEAPKPPNESYFTNRMSGEGTLDDNQVRARRSRELAKKNSPYYARVRLLEDEIKMAYTQLNEHHNHIIETNNGTRLICERLKYHTEQRIDLYWNAALRTHPAKDKMPVIPEPLPESEAELTYTSQHKTLENEVIAMFARKERLISCMDPSLRVNRERNKKGVE